MNDKKLPTQLIHAGRHTRFCQGAVNPVIQRASSLVFNTVADKKRAFEQRFQQSLFYGRRGTLTHFALQDALCELEGGAGGYLYPSGAAAVTNAILAFVSAGDHVLITAGAYEPTQEFCNVVLKAMNVSTTYYPPTIGAQITTYIQSNTKVVFLESPSSITMEVQDVPAMVAAIRAVNPEIVIIIDNTWAAGVLFPALAHGVDISVQAGTKYLVGHSDAMLGTAVSNERCWPQLRDRSYLMGQMVDADTAYAAQRGLRTLAVRLAQHQQSALTIAHWLTAHPAVAQVNHPALPSCVGHEFFQRDFLGSCGLFSFVLHNTLTETENAQFLDHFEHFAMAYSWGGYESLILTSQPAQLNAIRPAGKIDFAGTLVRVHIGLEHVDDLIADLERGLARIRQ